MTTRTLSLHDHLALRSLLGGYTTSTHHVANACGAADPRWQRGAITARTRTMLKRLERCGLVEGVSFPGGVVRWWRITDAGRKAVQP